MKGQRNVVKNEIYYILLFQFSLIFMQKLEIYQGQYNSYQRYQHTLQKQYCLQVVFHKDLQISQSLPQSAMEDNSAG